MNFHLSLAGRVRRAVGVTCVLLSAAASSDAGQTIPGVDIIVKTKPGEKAVQLSPNLPGGEMLPLNDVEFPIPTGTISTTRSNSKGGVTSIAVSYPMS